MGRDELPFNRAERKWVERTSKNGDSTVAFGSTKYIQEPRTPIFRELPLPDAGRAYRAHANLRHRTGFANPLRCEIVLEYLWHEYWRAGCSAVFALSKGAKNCRMLDEYMRRRTADYMRQARHRILREQSFRARGSRAISKTIRARRPARLISINASRRCSLPHSLLGSIQRMSAGGHGFRGNINAYGRQGFRAWQDFPHDDGTRIAGRAQLRDAGLGV